MRELRGFNIRTLVGIFLLCACGSLFGDPIKLFSRMVAYRSSSEQLQLCNNHSLVYVKTFQVAQSIVQAPQNSTCLPIRWPGFSDLLGGLAGNVLMCCMNLIQGLQRDYIPLFLVNSQDGFLCGFSIWQVLRCSLISASEKPAHAKAAEDPAFRPSCNMAIAKKPTFPYCHHGWSHLKP